MSIPRQTNYGVHWKMVALLWIVCISGPDYDSSSLRLWHGTIVVIYRTTEEIVVAADSRANNTESAFVASDDSCKIVALGSQRFFVGIGRMQAWEYGQQLFEGVRIAKEIEQSHPRASIEQMASAWGQGMVMRYKEARRRSPRTFDQITFPELGTGFFGGIDDAGSLVMYMVRIGRSPTIAATTKTLTWNPRKPLIVTGWGIEGYSEFAADTTERAQIRVREFTASIHNQPRERIGSLMIAAGVEAAIDWAPSPSQIGKPVDVLRLPRNGVIQWIKRKQKCYSYDAE